MRRMGNWYLLNDEELQKKISLLGYDVLVGDEVSNSKIINKFRRFRSNICKVLMNQKCLAGVGNYMKSEILYQTKVDPFIDITDLSDEKIIEIYKFSRKIAKQAYEYGGATLYTFTGLSGDKTDFKDTLKVYSKSVCPLGHKIFKENTPDNRTTHWVPEIQRPTKKLDQKKQYPKRKR